MMHDCDVDRAQRLPRTTKNETSQYVVTHEFGPSQNEPWMPISCSAGRITATDVLPVMPNTQKTTAASTRDSRQCGRVCVVHSQNRCPVDGGGGDEGGGGVVASRRRAAAGPGDHAPRSARCGCGFVRNAASQLRSGRADDSTRRIVPEHSMLACRARRRGSERAIGR